jgi:hypothetical protein
MRGRALAASSLLCFWASPRLLPSPVIVPCVRRPGVPRGGRDPGGAKPMPSWPLAAQEPPGSGHSLRAGDADVDAALRVRAGQAPARSDRCARDACHGSEGSCHLHGLLKGGEAYRPLEKHPGMDRRDCSRSATGQGNPTGRQALRMTDALGNDHAAPLRARGETCGFRAGLSLGMRCRETARLSLSVW